MSISALVVRGKFNGFIAGGLNAVPTEIRHTLVALSGGAAYGNKTDVEYAVWPTSQLASLGAPVLKSNAGTTDVNGVLVVDTSGVLDPNAKAILMVRKAQGVAGGADDDWGCGEVTAAIT